MRILIDECLDWRLGRALTEHQCVSVHRRGWKGLTNGVLLELAQREFDILLTADTNLAFQQNTISFSVAVVVLEARSTRLVHTVELMPLVNDALRTIQPGQIVRIT